MKSLQFILIGLSCLVIGVYIVDQQKVTHIPWQQAHLELIWNSACKDGDVKVKTTFATDRSNVNDYHSVSFVAWPSYQVESIIIE